MIREHNRRYYEEDDPSIPDSEWDALMVELRSLEAEYPELDAPDSPSHSVGGALATQFAEVVRRDLPMTHPMFSTMGELRSVTFRGRGARGDDVYDLVFANGALIMSAALDADGRMVGGMLRPPEPSGR